MAPEDAAGTSGSKLREHGLFFDHLVELVPLKHYYDDGDKLNPRFLNKAAKQAAKMQMKEHYKSNKKAKLDPDAPKTVLQHQQQRLASGAAATTSTAAAGDADAQPSTSQPSGTGLGHTLSLGSGKTSREELAARLRAKVEEARRAREAKAGTAQEAKEWRNKALSDNAKQKQREQQQKQKGQQQQQKQKGQQQQPAVGSKRKAEDDAAQLHQQGSGKQQQQQQRKQQQHQQQQQGGNKDAAGDFAFGRIVADDGSAPHGKKRPSKEVLLKQAEARKAQLESMAGSAEGKALATNYAWKAALGRAQGEKVMDDPKRLKRSIKMINKHKEKSAAKWKERVNAQKEAQEARQNKRNTNLQARKDAKLEARKAKREKKLLRAGFEGRKEGFIGGGGGGAGGGVKKPAAK